jgi:hypothetical protein
MKEQLEFIVACIVAFVAFFLWGMGLLLWLLGVAFYVTALLVVGACIEIGSLFRKG